MRKGLLALAVYLRGRRNRKSTSKSTTVFTTVVPTRDNIKVLVFVTAVCTAAVATKFAGRRGRVAVRPRGGTGFGLPRTEVEQVGRTSVFEVDLEN